MNPNQSPATEDAAGSVLTSAPHVATTAEAAPRDWWKRLKFGLRMMQVRLRFVIVAVVAFLVVGQWGTLQNHFDAVWHRLTGRHSLTQAVSGDTEFFCPMCPGVLSTWPAICPVCNMDLVRRKKGEAVLLPEGVVARMQFSPYRVQLAGIHTTVVEPQPFDHDQVLALPRSAVIDTGERRVVYIERMPGMFDGVEVTLGPRVGEFFPVLSGVQAGERVATAGAFLIDAEARLNPALASGYFGASRATSSTAESPLQPKPAVSTAAASKKKKSTVVLSAADLELVAKQKVCPVTDLPLDSMGGPIPVDVAGRRVFLCCDGCTASLQKDPEKYLKKLK
jgi:hypothetical protein